jgi:hypothetical protein
MTKDISLLHGGNEAIVEMQVGAADGRQSDPDNGIAWVEDLRIGYLLDVDLPRATPAKGLHRILLIAMFSHDPQGSALPAGRG